MLLENEIQRIDDNTALPAAGEMLLPVGEAALGASLALPEDATGLVILAQSSGSGRFNPRTRRIAGLLYRGRMATLLLDLLTPAEHELDCETAQFRLNVPRLAARLIAAIDWATRDLRVGGLPLGLFAAHTAAAAAIVAAAERPAAVSAVVCCGGRLDLAGGSLWRVAAPTLLMAGENDPVLLNINRSAAHELSAIHALEIVPAAADLMSDPLALPQVALLSRVWFQRHLRAPASRHRTAAH
jgi:dienelactone hydrolase